MGLRSLQENIDTDSASGRLIFHIFGALAQFERTQAVDLYKSRKHTALEVCSLMGRKARIPSESLLGLRRRLASLPARSPERRAEGLYPC